MDSLPDPDNSLRAHRQVLETKEESVEESKTVLLKDKPWVRNDKPEFGDEKDCPDLRWPRGYMEARGWAGWMDLGAIVTGSVRCVCQSACACVCACLCLILSLRVFMSLCSCVT